jgi:hypothetical protein
MKTLTIKIERTDGGFICRAANGDLPFEGRVHATRAAAIDDLNSAYDNATWHGRQTAEGYEIVID